MMEIRQQVILTGCLLQLYWELTRAQPYNQMKVVTDKPNDDRTIHENFQNLFESIAESNTEKSEVYQKMLREKVAENLRAFDIMNDELKITRNRWAHRRGDFQDKRNYNIMAIKREIAPVKLRSKSTVPWTIDLPRQYENHFGTNYSNPKGVWKLARDNLVDMLGELPDDPHKIQCTVVPKNSSALCEICKKAGDKIIQFPYQLISAAFYQGNLSFPQTRYKHEMRIDIVKCYCEAEHDDRKYRITLYVTKGKKERSAFFLNFYVKHDEKHDRRGVYYFLRPPYVTW